MFPTSIQLLLHEAPPLRHLPDIPPVIVSRPRWQRVRTTLGRAAPRRATAPACQR